MKLYSGPLSLFSRKVELALAEKGLAAERIMVPFSQARGYSPKHPEVLAANPKGQVPVLVDGALTLFDSTLILEYLEDAYPAPPLFPAGAGPRARCRLLELTADEILVPLVTRLMHRSEPPPGDPAQREAREAAAKPAEAALAAHFVALQDELDQQQFFCGAAFGVADIALFLTILYVHRLHGPRVDALPRLAAWYARVAARPAASRVVDEIAAADRALSPDLAQR